MWKGKLMNEKENIDYKIRTMYSEMRKSEKTRMSILMTDLQNARNGFGCIKSALGEILSELPVRMVGNTTSEEQCAPSVTPGFELASLHGHRRVHQ